MVPLSEGLDEPCAPVHTFGSKGGCPSDPLLCKPGQPQPGGAPSQVVPMSKRPAEDPSPAGVCGPARSSSGDQNQRAREEVKRRRREIWCGCGCEWPERMLALIPDQEGAGEFVFRCRCTWCGPRPERAAVAVNEHGMECMQRVSRRCTVMLRLPLPFCEDCREGGHGSLCRKQCC